MKVSAPADKTFPRPVTVWAPLYAREHRHRARELNFALPASCAGNLATLRALGVQAKLDVSRPADPEEMNADRTADAFLSTVAMGAEDRVDRACEGCQVEDRTIRRKPFPGDSALGAPPSLPRLTASGGESLPRRLRSDFERFFDTDLSDVRIHASASASDAARSIHARAFTFGRDIYFGSGQYSPESDGGRRLLAHELAHVVQQSSTVRRKIQRQSIHNPLFPCHETALMPGGMDFFGTLVHLAIQQHYVADIDPLAGTEYVIPGSSASGATGRADIVDSLGGIYEIKPLGLVAQGFLEAENYVLHAELGCDPNVNWHLGMLYFPPPVPMIVGGNLIVSWLYGPGVIAYTRSVIPPVPVPAPEREPVERPEREPTAEPRPAPDLVPEPGLRPVPVAEPSTYELIMRWAREVIESGADATQAADQFLRQHPEIAWTILILGVVGIIALAADDVTLVGIADDVLIPVIAALMRVAWRFA